MPRDEDNMRHKVSEEVDEAKKLSEEPQLWPANNHHGHCLVSKRAMRTRAWRGRDAGEAAYHLNMTIKMPMKKKEVPLIFCG